MSRQKSTSLTSFDFISLWGCTRGTPSGCKWLWRNTGGYSGEQINTFVIMTLLNGATVDPFYQRFLLIISTKSSFWAPLSLVLYGRQACEAGYTNEVSLCWTHRQQQQQQQQPHYRVTSLTVHLDNVYRKLDVRVSESSVGQYDSRDESKYLF